jgi:hypothetical protein
VSDDDFDARTQELLRQAEEARRVMDNPAFTRAFDKLEAEYTKSWGNTTPDEHAKRDVIYYRLQGLREARADLQRALNGEKVLAYHNRHATLKKT